MRGDRLLSILLLLQARRQLTARELAQRLEVSERTIQRDMAVLSATGIPVTAERGSGGGWRLLDNYRTDLTGLTTLEAQTLFLATPARLLGDLGLRQAAGTALIKLLTALPAPARRDAEYVRQRIYVDTASWRQAESAAPYLPLLHEALWCDRKLWLSYRRSDDRLVERLVDPLGLVAKGSAWYLVAGVDGEVRSYRAERVEAATLTDESTRRPADFDLAAFWDASTASLVRNLPRYPATVRIDPSILPRLRATGRYVQIEQVGSPDAKGWLPIALLCQGEEEACAYVLGFGARMEVLAPAELRATVIQRAGEVVSAYAGLGGQE